MSQKLNHLATCLILTFASINVFGEKAPESLDPNNLDQTTQQQAASVASPDQAAQETIQAGGKANKQKAAKPIIQKLDPPEITAIGD